MENIKETLGRWAVPFIVGAIAGMILLATIGGFDGGTAIEARVETAVEDTEDAYAEVLVPLMTQQCVANAASEPAKLAEIMAESSYRQRQAISDTGWVTYPEGASSSITREIDQGCIDALSE